MTDTTTRARALHSVAEARERRLDRELLAIWATVRSGNPAPLTELEVLHAVEDVRRERDALRARVDAVGRVLSENGCDCDCGCFWDEHGDDCDRCLACRADDAIARREDVVVEGGK